MKRFKKLLFFLVLAVSIWILYGVYETNQKPAAKAILPESEVLQTPTGTAPPLPSLYGKYTCLVDADTGRVLFGKDETSQVPMASTTKIMTALLILEKCDLNKVVTVSKYAASMPKVHLGASVGDSFYVKDLLYSMMLESHNDTAVILAEGLFGSVQNFAAEMNRKAQELHMTQTHFVTPNGLDSDGHYSSASDMCKLGSYAIKNKTFLEIIQTKTYQFSSIKNKTQYQVSNKDAFLSYYDGALGIKTGFTSKAGYCFVGAARRDETSLVSCTLASGWPPNKNYKWADTKTLMDYGFNTFRQNNLPLYPMSNIKIPIVEGKKDVVSCRCNSPGAALSAAHETIKVKYKLPSSLNAPIRQNVAIGTVSYYINDKFYKEVEIFPSESIEKSDFSDTIRDVFQTMTNIFCS